MSNSFSWPIRVYYEDTDAGGVVFYANYLKFFERSRTEFLRNVGFEQDILRQQFNILFVVKSVNIDYLKPAYFNDLIQVSADIVEQTKTSLIFNQTVMRDHDILNHGQIRIACVDAQSFKPKPIPTVILEKIT